MLISSPDTFDLHLTAGKLTLQPMLPNYILQYYVSRFIQTTEQIPFYLLRDINIYGNF